MRAGMLAWLAVAALVWAAAAAPVPGLVDAARAQEPGVSTDAQMRRIQILLKKLRESMQSLKDLDDLEKAGMPKRDVDRMRRALRQKIQEMIDETIASIREL